MKKIVYLLTITYMLVKADTDIMRLNSILRDIENAKAAPFLFKPYHAWMINNQRIPQQNSVQPWLKDDCCLSKYKKKQTNKSKNRDVLQKASDHFAEKNKPLRIFSNTVINGLLFGTASWAAQCLYSRCTGEPVHYGWNAFFGTIGVAWSLLSHRSMKIIQNKADAILENNVEQNS